MSQVFVSPDAHFSVSSSAATFPSSESTDNPATRPALTPQMLAGLEDLKLTLLAFRESGDRQ
jgi:hypothetical protein